VAAGRQDWLLFTCIGNFHDWKLNLYFDQFSSFLFRNSICKLKYFLKNFVELQPLEEVKNGIPYQPIIITITKWCQNNFRSLIFGVWLIILRMSIGNFLGIRGWEFLRIFRNEFSRISSVLQTCPWLEIFGGISYVFELSSNFWMLYPNVKFFPSFLNLIFVLSMARNIWGYLLRFNLGLSYPQIFGCCISMSFFPSFLNLIFVLQSCWQCYGCWPN